MEIKVTVEKVESGSVLYNPRTNPEEPLLISWNGEVFTEASDQLMCATYLSRGSEGQSCWSSVKDGACETYGSVC